MMDKERSKGLYSGDLPLEGKKQMMIDESSVDLKSNQSSLVHSGDLPLEGKKEKMIDGSDEDLESNQSSLVGGLPVAGGSEVISFASKKTKKIRIIASLIIALITIVIALTLGFLLKGDGEGKTTQSSSVSSSSTKDIKATLEKLEKVKDFVIERGLSKSETFERDSSPQAKAALFMAEDTYIVPTEKSFYNDTLFWIERYAVAVFYHSTGGPKWRNSYKFLRKGVSICDWGSYTFSSSGVQRFGIGCNKRKRVVDITIVANSLNGTLPDELGFLSEIMYFSLSHNSITGTFSSRMRYWKNLVFFDMRHNSFEGKLPSWLHNWRQLELLGLSNNGFTGSIPSGFRSMKNLTYLFLEDNLLEGTLDNLEQNTELKSLYIEDNALSQNIDSSFLAFHKKLLRLDISDNEFYGEVPVHLFSGNNFDVLDAHGNQISSFPDSISEENNTLSFLALQFNPLAGPFPKNAISNMKNLRHLDLTSTSMTGTMPNELGDLNRLRYVFMADTKFNPGPIPDEYQKLTILNDLSLKKSGRTGKIPSWIGQLSGLMLLDLHSNSLSGTIPSVLGSFKNLWFLLLQRNKLQGSVPFELGNSSLTALFLDHNDIIEGVQDLCETLPTNTRLTSDCGTLSNEIECKCCRVCCDDEEESNGCTEHAENDYLALLEPQWQDNFDRADPINDYQARFSFTFGDYNITR